MNARQETIEANGHTLPVLILSPRNAVSEPRGALWIHGGGYVAGTKEMVLSTRAVDLVQQFGCTVVAPDYRLAPAHPYPAAFDDCYATLLWLKDNAARLGVNEDSFIVGGESAGGGLAAAVCMKARDRGEVDIALQLPLYPMLDNLPTETNVNNHGKVWDSTLNDSAWKAYLGDSEQDEDACAYAVPARQTDYTNLPPCYTFVGTGEPFFAETLSYVENLHAVGVNAIVDVYNSDVHAFDMEEPNSDLAKEAVQRFRDRVSGLL